MRLRELCGLLVRELVRGCLRADLLVSLCLATVFRAVTIVSSQIVFAFGFSNALQGRRQSRK